MSFKVTIACLWAWAGLERAVQTVEMPTEAVGGLEVGKLRAIFTARCSFSCIDVLKQGWN
jgi:hypothetical protein